MPIEDLRPGSERAILVGVEVVGSDGERPLEHVLEEMAELVRSAGGQVLGTVQQRLHAPNPRTYVGAGKVEEVLALQRETGAGLVVVSAELSPSQLRNLEQAIPAKVIDRTGLILDIFAQRARTHEARLQVELAQSRYLLPRLTGYGLMWSRTAGGIGTRGPGETQIETDRRLIRRRIGELARALEDVRHQREMRRKPRSRSGMPVVALVGYTNAGKSTLLNAVSGAGVMAENRLFATLDPTTRQVALPSGQLVLMSDTVGFIHKLPPTLVAAFRATLEELHQADVLLHVLDITSDEIDLHEEVVESLLEDLGVLNRPILTVLNKVDLCSDAAAMARRFPGAVLISARTGQGLDGLMERVEAMLARDYVEADLRLPYSKTVLLELFRRRGLIEQEGYDAEGAHIRGRIPRALWPRFERYAV